MTLSEAALQVYIGLLFCAVAFSIVVILTVWSVHKKRRKAKQGDGGGDEVIKPWFSTCDWGDCDGQTVGFRFDDNADELSKTTGYGWLPVCAKHYDEEPDENRRVKL